MEKSKKRKQKQNTGVHKIAKPAKGTGVKKWNTVEVEMESLFSESVVSGFLGLEELDGYDEEDLKKIIEPAKTKRRKRTQHVEQNIPKEEEEEEEGDKEDTSMEHSQDLPNNADEIQNEDNATDEKVKKLTKKQRRKEQRKQSFKLLLKERRKKRKELKRLAKMGHENNVSEPELKQKDPEVDPEVVAKLEKTANLECVDMGDWNGLGVPEEIIKALQEKGFTSPTPIQREALPHAILYRKDIIGAAETGSGKTLAFGIPLLKNIMELKQRRLAKKAKLQAEEDTEEKPLYALVITPTRELALQIDAHITAVGKYTGVKSVVVVGGLAAAKQERLLSKCPEIVIGTPGRLHKLITNGDLHLSKFDNLKFLVIDECDRMLDEGHFKELNDILNFINNSTTKKQTFLFSATLTLPKQVKQQRRHNKKDVGSTKSELEQLVDKVGAQGKVQIIDLTTKHVTAAMLKQSKVMCTNEEKEIYLLYFLMTHPGRTIVFVNSISLTKRLSSLLSLLEREPLQLHAGKQQRQRLKYLDRFVQNENGLLIATDVAARGLDIPKVQYVVHYQLPVDPKVYIHRAGRTARAQEDGLSFVIQGPEDFNAYKKIVQVLKLNDDISSLSVDRGYLDGIKVRVRLAREIDKEEYKHRKENADKKWMDRTAKSMDIDVDDDASQEVVFTKKQKQSINYKKRQLQQLLKTKLVPKGFSASYPTRTGSLMTLGQFL